MSLVIAQADYFWADLQQQVDLYTPTPMRGTVTSPGLAGRADMQMMFY